MKNKKIGWIIGIALVGLAIWYFYFRPSASTSSATDTLLTGSDNGSGTGSNLVASAGKVIPFSKALAVPNQQPGNQYFGKLQLIVPYPHGLVMGDVVKIQSANGTYSGAHKITYIYNNAASKIAALYFADVNFTVNDTGTVTV